MIFSSFCDDFNDYWDYFPNSLAIFVIITGIMLRNDYVLCNDFCDSTGIMIFSSFRDDFNGDYWDDDIFLIL